MNNGLFALLRALGGVIGDAVHPRAGRALNAIADALEAGTAIDDHMQKVADELNARHAAEAAGETVDELDWNALIESINAESEAIQDEDADSHPE